MALDIKRIIREEMMRLAEGEVIRPSFKAKKTKRPSPFELSLKKIEELVIDETEALSMNHEMSGKQAIMLDDLLTTIRDMKKEYDAGDDDDFHYEDEDEPHQTERAFGREPSRSERDELKRMMSKMGMSGFSGKPRGSR